jgi:branched-chain amino acid transport system substrate-binding protein
MRRPVTLLIASLLAIASAGGVRAGESDPLVLASLAPETGDLSQILRTVRLPVELAVDEINAAGGVNGQDVILVLGDEGEDADAALAAIDHFEAEQVDAIQGPTAATTTVAVLDAVTSSGMLMCSGSDSLTPVDDGDGFYFRTAPPSRLQGPALAELILSDGHRRVAIIRRRDSFGSSVGKSLARRLRRGGGRVAANVSYDTEAGDFETEVERVVATEPDAIAILGFDIDGAAILRELEDQGMTPSDVGIYVPDTMRTPAVAAAGIKGVTPAAAPYDVDSPFHETFAEIQEPPVFWSYYYDCTILTALAAVNAESAEASAMTAAFTENLRGDEDCNTFAACKKLLEVGKSIHWRGASSNFDDYGDFEPNEGVYDTWSSDDSGDAVTGDPSEQIHVP